MLSKCETDRNNNSRGIKLKTNKARNKDNHIFKAMIKRKNLSNKKNIRI
jgi:hypothetical protein